MSSRGQMKLRVTGHGPPYAGWRKQGGRHVSLGGLMTGHQLCGCHGVIGEHSRSKIPCDVIGSAECEGKGTFHQK
jgi:hypothetical protein